MIKKIEKPTIIRSAGNKQKLIEEYIGLVNSHTPEISIAHMKSPQGWEEPGQNPEFDEYTVVLHGMVRVRTKTQVIDVRAGEAIIVGANEWIQYSTPGEDGAEYIAVCTPAFSPKTVHREDDSTIS